MDQTEPTKANPYVVPKERTGSLPEPTLAQRPTNIRWVIFAFSVITSWLLYLHRYTFGLIRPELSKEFTPEQLGYMESAFYWPYALGQLPSGAICDLFGAHLFVGGSIVIWSLMLLLMAFTTSPLLFCVARGLFGAAQAGTYPSLAKVTRIWFPPQSRTLIQACVASFGGRSGAALCPIIFYMLMIYALGFSWQMALAIFSAGGALFGLAFLLFFRSSPEVDSRVNDAERELITADSFAKGPAKPADSTPSIPFAKFATSWTIWIFAAQQFFNAGADILFVGHLASYFKQELGIEMSKSPISLAMFICLPFLGGAIGGVVAGYLNDYLIARTGNRRWVRSGVAFTGNLVACILVFVAINQVNPWAVAIALTATKFFTDWTQPTGWGACTDIGGKSSATLMGLINMAGNLGAATMPLVFGFVLSSFQHKELVNGAEVTITNYKPVFIIGAILFLLSASSWFLIDCTKTLETERKAH